MATTSHARTLAQMFTRTPIVCIWDAARGEWQCARPPAPAWPAHLSEAAVQAMHRQPPAPPANAREAAYAAWLARIQPEGYRPCR